MPSMEAFLDDELLVVVNVNRRYYNGLSESFYLSSEDQETRECVISSIEEHEREVRYFLTLSKGITFGKRWYLHEGHGYIAPLKMRFVVRKPSFIQTYVYDGKDLGSYYQKTEVSFALFAPTAYGVTLKLNQNGRLQLFPMQRDEKGVYRVVVKGNYAKATYTYLVERDGIVVETLDPYALSSTANGKASAVIDLSKLEELNTVTPNTKFEKLTDAILYECSIRDMTSSYTANTKTHGKFVSLLESGTTYKGLPTGLDYLSSLGVTHVQLQPIGDFATVDEEHPERLYNWGYDPLQFVSLEGSYASNPNDPYARMIEFKKLVNQLHERDLRVNLDLVLNHVYDLDLCSLSQILPYYYFRYNERGYCSNGSFCGNDIDSEKPMVRHLFTYLIDTYLKVYDVDGFRFDLMGILDVECMNQLYSYAKDIKPNVMFYGEGWNMPTVLEGFKKAMIENQEKMPKIGHFNDVYRDILKGATSDDQLYEKGYLTGDLSKAFASCSAMGAHVLKDPYFYRFDDPCKSINAIETHDNATLWDKMHFACMNEPREMRKKRQKMMIASILVSQGIPFLHAGMEFLGTKNDNTNSYNAKDEINGMDYERMYQNQDVLEYTKNCIRLRKAHPEFSLSSSKEIEEMVHFGIDDNSILFYNIHYKDHETCVIVNPNQFDTTIPFDEEVQIIFNQAGLKEEQPVHEVFVPSLTLIVIQKY